MTLFRRLLPLALALLVVPAQVHSATDRDEEAHALVREVLSQQPESMQVRCLLKMRGGGRDRSEVLVRYTTISGNDSWRSIYETQGRTPEEQLIVAHRGELPNQYIYRTSAAGENARPIVLNGNEAAIPFAGSDFWLSDLGMEFLHWPEQRLVRDAKITMRMGRPCKILESISPTPDRGYSRVLSWIDAEFNGLIYAEAYGADERLMKVFSLKGFKKINGVVHVKEMEIRNDRDDSRTRLEFLFDEP